MSSTVYGVFCPQANCMGLYVTEADAIAKRDWLNSQTKDMVYFQANSSTITGMLVANPGLLRMVLDMLNLSGVAQQTVLGAEQAYSVQENTE